MRRELRITITDDGRDKGSTYLLTEMPASQGEAWAIRLLLALAKADVEMPSDMEQLSMAKLAEIGMKAITGLHWEVAAPLLDEMFGCIRFCHDKSKPKANRELEEEDIQEIATRLKLRVEVFKLHTDFLKAVAPLISRAEKAAATAR